MYYAFVEKVEALGRLRHVRLEAFPGGKFETLRNVGLQDYSEPLEGSVVEFVATTDAIRGVVGRSPLREGTWRSLHFIDREGLPARRYLNPLTADDPGEYVFIAEIGSVVGEVSRALSRLFVPGSQQDAGAVLQRLDKTTEYAVCVKVGQGNCVALCDAHTIPFAYVDVGGGCYANAKTRPSTIDLCLSGNPTVILSHWDADHWYGAVLDPRLLGQTWIAPKQRIGPVAAELCRKIEAKGRLETWPTSAKGYVGRWGALVKCTGRGRNNAGLASIVWLPTSDPALVLLPGDCEYRHVPCTAHHAFSGVVAAHHGAAIRSIRRLVARGDGAHVCYSYGVGNGYGHPADRAIEQYYTDGWRRRSDTPEGNVSVVRAPVQHRCADSSCAFTLGR